MEYDSIKKIYHNYSNIYDLIFKQMFYPRQRHAIQKMKIRPNDRILDVGVGTGLTLPLYPRDCHVTGIDLSSSMLRKAERKKREHRLEHVTLMEMDACDLQFADDHFDQVVATFVVSVVPDPVKAVAEMKRVCKPGHRIILVNHFLSEKKLVAKAEELIDPLCRKLGWCATLALPDLAEASGLQVDDCFRMKKFDPWSIVLATNTK